LKHEQLPEARENGLLLLKELIRNQTEFLSGHEANLFQILFNCRSQNCGMVRMNGSHFLTEKINLFE
jgi:hypothetical protein